MTSYRSKQALDPTLDVFDTNQLRLFWSPDQLEVLPVLSPKQLAELLVLPLPAPPQKDAVINGVFDFLLASPQRLPEVLHHLVQVANEVKATPPREVLHE